MIHIRSQHNSLMSSRSEPFYAGGSHENRRSREGDASQIHTSKELLSIANLTATHDGQDSWQPTSRQSTPGSRRPSLDVHFPNPVSHMTASRLPSGTMDIAPGSHHSHRLHHANSLRLPEPRYNLAAVPHRSYPYARHQRHVSYPHSYLHLHPNTYVHQYLPSSSAYPHLIPGQPDEYPAPERARRRRRTQACEYCRQKRVRCEGSILVDGKTLCINCANDGVQCVFNEPKKRGPKPKNHHSSASSSSNRQATPDLLQTSADTTRPSSSQSVVAISNLIINDDTTASTHRDSYHH